MSPSISIRPSKDIRTNYAQISALTRQNPVAITVNGKEDTVLLSHEDFQDQLHYINELEYLLPQTGGPGPRLYFLLGTLLMAFSAAAECARRRRERRVG